MNVAIHNGNGWNKNWVQYLEEQGIPYVLVDCYASDIISTLKAHEVTHLMWHFTHNSPTDIFMARNILFSAQVSGIKVFPDINASWHFDDKVSQKYLLESIDAPLVPSHVFYSEDAALEWAKTTTYPKVAKLRRGAGSYNVRLIKSQSEARRYIKRMFSEGVDPSPGYLADVKTKLKVAGSFSGIMQRLKKAPGFFKMVYHGRKGFPKEKNYVYFQDFIPNNSCDYRIIVVNSKAYGVKRMVRKGDFRASGGGMFDFGEIDPKIIQIAQDTAKRLNMLSVAFDFVLDGDAPLIVEISYGFGTNGSGKFNMYWDKNNKKIIGRVNAPYEIISGFLDSGVRQLRSVKGGSYD